jgi:hypothetical protein
MEEQEKQADGRRRGLVAAAVSAAAIGVALPVAGAFASGDSGGAAGDSADATNVPVQTQRDGNCPEKDGSGGGSSSGASVQL